MRQIPRDPGRAISLERSTQAQLAPVERPGRRIGALPRRATSPPPRAAALGPTTDDRQRDWPPSSSGSKRLLLLRSTVHAPGARRVRIQPQLARQATTAPAGCRLTMDYSTGTSRAPPATRRNTA